MIYTVSPNMRNNIRPLFEGFNETMVWSCLQGHMGRAWADNLSAPKSSQIIVGDFCCLAGAPNRKLAQNIPADHPNPSILMVPTEDAWHGLIQDAHRGHYERFNRYAFYKDSSAFDRDHLKTLISMIPEGYQIVPIGEALFRSTRDEEWSKDFCSQFPSYELYQKRGAGYVVLCDGRPVCGASSYTFYDEGIEIEIGTSAPHRRKGLAAACGATLILSCLDRGIYPSWDAANPESADLARKLGYRIEREYVTYEIALDRAVFDG